MTPEQIHELVNIFKKDNKALLAWMRKDMKDKNIRVNFDPEAEFSRIHRIW